MNQLIAYPKKLTDWANEPTVEVLRADLEAAKTVQTPHISRIKHWRDLLEITGSAKPPKVKGRSSVQPKLIRKQAEWRYAALSEPFLSSNKLFHVRPVSFEDADAARQNELVLNWQFRTKLNKVRLIDQYVRACVDDGTVIVRLGWLRQTEKVTEEVPVWELYPIQDEQQSQALQQAVQLKQENLRLFKEQSTSDIQQAVEIFETTGEATIPIQVGTTPVEVEEVLVNAPTVQILNPENVYIDPSCDGDFDQALFVIYSFETNKAELLKEPHRYHNLDAVNWSASVVGDANHSYSFNDARNVQGATRKKVVAYEYWGYYDIHNTGKLEAVVITWIGSVIVRMELNPFPDGKPPFVVVPYLPVKRSVYGEPDAEMLEENQKVLGAVTRGMVDLLGRSANAQHGFAKNMLDALNRRRYEDGQDYEFNPHANPMGGGMIEHKYPEIPNSALTLLGMQNQEAESLTGIKAFHGGLSGNAYGNVATGIKGMIDAAGKREMGILRRLAQGMVEIGTKIVAMNGEFMSEEEVIRVTNEDFIPVKREDLKGNFDLEVDIATAEIDESKAQDLGFMLQTIGPNMDMNIRNIILAEIATYKRMPDLAQKIRTYQPEPSPQEQEMAQIELEKAKKELMKLEAEIVWNQARSDLAAAQAAALGVDITQKTDGTKHIQEIEKQQAQARGNQSLQVTKALTKSRKPDELPPDIDAAIGYNALSPDL